jgi:hypothetical protein
MPDRPEDPVLKTARREAIVAVAIWVAAAVWSVGYCTLFGYRRDPATLTFVLGFPDWVFWGVILPWVVCVGLCVWFAYGFMKDAEFGAEVDERGADDE